MGRVIHKAVFDRHLENKIIHVPRDAFQVLHVDRQGDNIAVWYETLDGDSPVRREEYELAIVGTGHVIPERAVHLGTALYGTFVWHVYGSWK